MHIADLFEDRAREGDGRFAVAFAILQLADQQKSIALALDRLGVNSAVPQAGPGAFEFIGMEFSRIADALQAIADKEQ
jgi:hypothetical protein